MKQHQVLGGRSSMRCSLVVTVYSFCPPFILHLVPPQLVPGKGDYHKQHTWMPLLTTSSRLGLTRERWQRELKGLSEQKSGSLFPSPFLSIFTSFQGLISLLQGAFTTWISFGSMVNNNFQQLLVFGSFVGSIDPTQFVVTSPPVKLFQSNAFDYSICLLSWSVQIFTAAKRMCKGGWYSTETIMFSLPTGF